MERAHFEPEEAFRERIRSAWVRAAYDALKRAHEGGPMDTYREAKDRFFTRLRESPAYAAVRPPAGPGEPSEGGESPPARAPDAAARSGGLMETPQLG